jgi:predicted metal-dependent phosphoesterase TrpH
MKEVNRTSDVRNKKVKKSLTPGPKIAMDKSGRYLYTAEENDHIQKHNKDISDANQKLSRISNLAHNADKGDTAPKPAGYLGKLGGKGIIEKDGMILHNRANSDYDELFHYFLKNEAEDYFREMGYSKEDVIRIGYKNFIDAHDWSTIEDIKKWRTDAVHIIPCVHCKKEFATYELDFGLCKKCTNLYDMQKFAKTCAANEAKDPGISYGMRAAFAFHKSFRECYLK